MPGHPRIDNVVDREMIRRAHQDSIFEVAHFFLLVRLLHNAERGLAVQSPSQLPAVAECISICSVRHQGASAAEDLDLIHP